VIDDSSHPSTSAGKVNDLARDLQLDRFLRFYGGDFRGASKNFSTDLLPFDCVWFDCGGLDDFASEYWSLINPHGGLLMIHSTLSNPAKRSFVTELKRKYATPGAQSLEIVSFLEPHKWRQNSFTLVRFVSPELERSYKDEE
jgi:hypothetical protein